MSWTCKSTDECEMRCGWREEENGDGDGGRKEQL